MTLKKTSPREKMRNLFLAFLEHGHPKGKANRTELLSLCKTAQENKNYLTLQIQTEFGKVETISGWILRISEENLLTLRLSKVENFLDIPLEQVLKISLAKAKKD